MAWDNAVVTNAGVLLLKDVLAGGVLTLGYATGGTGTVSAASLMAQTALKEQKQQFTIVSSMNVTNGKKIKIQITNLGLSAGYTLHQIGIWAHVDSGAPVLFAILQDSSGIAVPAESELADFVLSFYAVVNFSNEAAFTMTVDSSALVSMSTLAEALQGKADLGDDGKIPESQLPDMDYDEKGSADAALTAAKTYTDTSAAAALASAKTYTDTSAAAALTEAKAYADAATPTFVYKCAGDADSTAIANIVNDFFNNGTAMSMKLIITGTMGIAFTNTYYAMYINATNSRGAKASLDFSDCHIPEITTATRDFLYVTGGAILDVFGWGATTSRYGAYCTGSSVSTFTNCMITGTTYSIYNSASTVTCINCTISTSGTTGAYLNGGTTTWINCTTTASTYSVICQRGSINTFINCIIIGTASYGVQCGSTFSGTLVITDNCKIKGGINGVRVDTANTSAVIKLLGSRISGPGGATNISDLAQSTAAGTAHWIVEGCSFANGSVTIAGTKIYVTTTVETEYIAIQAYHNLFSQTIE